MMYQLVKYVLSTAFFCLFFGFTFTQIFGTNNVEQTFQLGFSVLCSSDGDPSTRKHAADLLIDISSNHRIQQALKQ